MNLCQLSFFSVNFQEYKKGSLKKTHFLSLETQTNCQIAKIPFSDPINPLFIGLGSETDIP